MANLVTGKNKLALEICNALGLKYVVRSLDFHMAIDEISTVTVEFYPEIDGVRQFPAILKKFELVPIKEEKNLLKEEYGLDGLNDKKASPPPNFINERDM